MKRYDKALSVNGIAIAEPPASAHSGQTPQHVSCASDLYPEYFADISEEIANAIEDAGIVLDGTDRTQLFQAITAIAIASSPTVPGLVANSPVLLATSTVQVPAFTNFSFGSPPAGATGVIIKSNVDDRFGAEGHVIEIRDTNLNVYRVAQGNVQSLGSTTSDTGISEFSITGGSSMAYRVPRILGAADTTFSFNIERWGYR